MATALRLKRKAGEVAADTIVLAPKIARMVNDQAATNATVNYTFHYAGSFKNPDSAEAKEAIRRAKEANRLKQDPKLRPAVDVQSKLRDEYRTATKKKRFQSVLRHRAMLEEVYSEEIVDNDLNALRETTNGLFRLYDVLGEDTEPDQTKENAEPKEKETTSKITCNNVAMVRGTVKEPEKEKEILFDVYFSAAQFDLLREDEYSLFKLDGPEAIAAWPEYDSDSDLDVNTAVFDDDSDSNAEDNWRNDYPDEEYGNGLAFGGYYEEYGRNIMSGQMKGLRLNVDDDSEPDG